MAALLYLDVAAKQFFSLVFGLLRPHTAIGHWTHVARIHVHTHLV